MKKKVILLILVLLTSFTTNLFAQKDRKLTKGTSINLIAGLPSVNYGFSIDDKLGSNYQLAKIWGLQIGNRWYISPAEKYGFGLMINWIDITAGAIVGVENSLDWVRSVADVSFFEIGPIGTYALTNDIALDAYYNLRPTGFASIMQISYSIDDKTYSYAGFGFTHAIGGAFRYKVLNIGLEYVMGSVNSAGTYSGASGDKTLESKKNVTNNFRIMFGVKF